MHKTVDRRPVLIYCRESRDENGESYERIETQRDILLDFCRRRGLVNVVDVILDDDTSGTSFRRFDPVIERVRQGEIQVLVFKDASRLGRNLKESLIFVDLVESCGAEILFESEEYNEDFFRSRRGSMSSGPRRMDRKFAVCCGTRWRLAPF